MGSSTAITLLPVEVTSPGELWAVTPPGPGAPAEVAVTLGRSDGMKASWGERFSYYRLDLAQAAQALRAPTPVTMASADLDRDGRLDAAVATAEPPGLVLLRGQADGGLAFFRRIDVTRRPAGVAAADVNGNYESTYTVALNRTGVGAKNETFRLAS